MGFNKRYLTDDTVKRVYEDRGLEGLTEYITKPDALFTSSEKTSKIVEIVCSDKCDTNKIMEIEKIWLI